MSGYEFYTDGSIVLSWVPCTAQDLTVLQVCWSRKWHLPIPGEHSGEKVLPEHLFQVALLLSHVACFDQGSGDEW